ncbi:MAG TPA: hypothetical protein VGB44_10295 [Flavobacterium sp.]
MKSFKFLLAAVLFSGLTFTSCSNDDDDNNDQNVTTGEIMAKWNHNKTVQNFGGTDTEDIYENQEPECGDDYIQFAAGGVFNRVVFDRDVDTQACVTEFATPAVWTRTDNTLTISNGPYAGNYTISKLNNNELEFWEEEITAGSTTTRTYYFTKDN